MSRSRRTGQLGAVLARMMGAQIIVQGVALATGLIIVRSLDRDDYAAYSLLVAVVSGASLFANSGLASTILSRGASVRGDQLRVSSLMVTALHFRRRAALWPAIAAGALLFVLLVRLDRPLAETWPLALAASLTVVVGAASAVYNELLALEYRRAEMMRVALVTSLARLVGQCLLTATRMATSLTSALVNLGGVYLSQRMQQRYVRRIVPSGGRVDDEETVHLRRAFRLLLPGNALAALQGQVVFLILGSLGHAGSIADIGAVSRYSAVFGLITGTAGVVLVPMVARADVSRVRRRYGLVMLLVSVVCVIPVVVVMAFSSQMLALLGDHYLDLVAPLRIVFAGAALACVANILSALNQARGWLNWAWLQVPFALVTLVVVLSTVDVSTSDGAAWLGVSMCLPGLLAESVQFLASSRRKRSVDVRGEAKSLENA